MHEPVSRKEVTPTMASTLPSGNDPTTTKATVGRHPRRSSRTTSPGPRLSDSRYLGCLLWLQSSQSRKLGYLPGLSEEGPCWNLSLEQRQFIGRLQSRLNLEQIQAAERFAHRIASEPRIRGSLEFHLRRQVPRLAPPPRQEEKRRIGVGYRDKGTLRPRHKPRLPGSRLLAAEHANVLLGGYSKGYELGELVPSDEVLSDRSGAPPGLAYLCYLEFMRAKGLSPSQLSQLAQDDWPIIYSHP
jgi:hypothetical protein